jgi:hypothetical protein
VSTLGVTVKLLEVTPRKGVIMAPLWYIIVIGILGLPYCLIWRGERPSRWNVSGFLAGKFRFDVQAERSSPAPGKTGPA